MSVTISNSFTQRHYNWVDWKVIQLSKSLVYQYDDDGLKYTIWGYDNQEVYTCTIWKGTVPNGIIGSYSQVQNDSDKNDFESNYKSNGNLQLKEPIRDRTISQNITSNGQIVSISSEGAGVIGLQISGTWVGTLAFEGTIDRNNWFNLASFPPGGVAFVTSTTTNGVWKINASGINTIRTRATSFTSGIATIAYDVGMGSTLVAAIQGSPTAISNGWPIKITDGYHVAPLDGYGNLIMVGSGTAGSPAGGVLTIQGISNGVSLPVNVTGISTGTSDTIATGNLGALNNNVSIALAGTTGCGMQLAAGTLIGTITPEVSYDGGITWNPTYFDGPPLGNKVSSIVFGSSNTATASTIVSRNGASHVRVRVSAFTSGTAICNLRATTQNQPPVLFSGLSGHILPPSIAQVGGSDDNLLLQPIHTDSSGNVGISALSQSSSYPDPSSDPINGQNSIYIDAFENLQIRGPVITDEGSFRDDFSGSSLQTTLTGTLTFTNGSTAVTGSGTIFTSELNANKYIRLSSNSDIYLVQISEIDSDTSLILSSPYQGTTGTGSAIMTYWVPTVPAGGSITVGSSLVNLAQSTTNGSVIMIERGGDYLPSILQFQASISQRLANQVTHIGLEDVPGSANQSAVVIFDGTTATTVKFHTQFASDSVQETVCVIPSGGVSSGNHLYEIDLKQNVANLVIDGSLVASHSLHLPWPYQPLSMVAYTQNNATVGSSTTLSIDTMFFQDLDDLQVSNIFTGAPFPVQIVSAFTASVLTGLVSGLVALGGGSASTLNPIRATTYNEPSTNAQRSISSSSASDTSAGVGARQITITYYDSTGSGPNTEIITLNGTTAVNTVNTNICFIEKMVVTSVGTTNTNVGTITLFNSTGGGGGTIGTIGVGNLISATGDGRTLWAHHYVANGKTASLATVILSNFGGTGSGITTMILRSKQIGVANAADIQISDLIAVATGASIVRQLGIPIKVVGPARILAYTIPASNNTTSEFSFDFSEQ